MPYGRFASGELGQLIAWLQYSGVMDIILPFLLVFTIIFAVFERVKLFGTDKKNVNVGLALIIAILTIVPSMTGVYSYQYDPVRIINTLVPSAAVLGVVIILVLFLIGMFGKDFIGGGPPTWLVAIIFLILFYIFGITVNWWQPPSRASSFLGGDLLTLVVVILVFGLIIAFITSDPKSKGEKVADKIAHWFFK